MTVQRPICHNDKRIDNQIHSETQRRVAYTARCKKQMIHDLHTIAPNVITIRSDWDIIGARMAARDMARRIGFGTIDQARIATVASELARHSVVEGTEGSLTLCYTERGTWSGIELLLEKHGPTMDYDASSTATQANGSNNGHRNGSSPNGSNNGHSDSIGLKAAGRLIDEMEADAVSNTLTTIVCRKWLRS